MINDDVLCGLTGTALGAVGTGLSVTEIQAIISIIVTVASFLIGVLIPLVVKIVKKYKEAKKDGVVTKEEKEDIVNTVKESIPEIKKGIEDIKQVSHKEKKE